VQLIFGKSLVSGTVTGDVLEGIAPGPIAFVRPSAPGPLPHAGVSIGIGGPWRFYEDFRRAHDLTQMPRAEVPEISVAAGTTLQVPLILCNDGNDPVEVVLSTSCRRDGPSRVRFRITGWGREASTSSRSS